MKKSLILVCLLLLSYGTASEATVNAGISISDSGGSFFLAIGDYFSVPQREVIIIRERRIQDNEIPVVFFIAERTRVSTGIIIDLRLKGMSWFDISTHFGLGPEIYYVPVKETAVIGPPYGKAYGYYKKKPKKEWKQIKLGDNDIINLVNLRFISDYYEFAPENIIKMRESGKNFVNICDDIEKGKGKDKVKTPKEHKKGRGKSRK